VNPVRMVTSVTIDTRFKESDAVLVGAETAVVGVVFLFRFVLVVVMISMVVATLANDRLASKLQG